MRLRFAIAALAMLFAGCAHAQLVPFAGQIVYGDNVNHVRVQMSHDTPDGRQYTDLAGVSKVTLVLKNASTGRSREIDGEVFDTARGTVSFDSLGTSLPSPGTRKSDTYDCRVRFVRGGGVSWSGLFRISIVVFP